MGNEWRKAYGTILKKAISIYNLDKKKIISSDPSAIHHWFNGRNLPNGTSHDKICEEIEKMLREESNPHINNEMINTLNKTLEHLDLKLHDGPESNEIGKFAVFWLKKIYSNGKERKEVNKSSSTVNKRKPLEKFALTKIFPETGNTQAVVFDFDGTLTVGNTGRTTWESIWVELGYDVKECIDLHRLFDKGEINHATWCKLTEVKFKERKLNRDMILKISSKIPLIKGCKETFEELHRRSIKIYIVSGSILLIIQNVLKELYHYIDEVKANDFKFSSEGLLTEIIGTKYDFSGKASFIRKVASKMKISAKDILFIGNSYNDKHAYKSGAQTLCINPKETDISNFKVWNDYIKPCENLFEILNPRYIRRSLELKSFE